MTVIDEDAHVRDRPLKVKKLNVCLCLGCTVWLCTLYSPSHVTPHGLAALTALTTVLCAPARWH